MLPQFLSEKETHDSALESQSRYKELILYSGIFIFLVASLFLLNYGLSIKSSEDTSQTFCANRTERAWQRAVKNLTLFNIGFYGQDDSLLQAFGVYQESIKNFDSLLTALKFGGRVNADGEIITVVPIEGNESKASLDAINRTWSSLRTDFLLLSNMSPRKVSTAVLDRSIEGAVKMDDVILDELSLLMIELSENSSKRLKQAQLIQVFALLICLVMFMVMAFRLSISLRRSDEIIATRNRELVLQRDELLREKETIEQLLLDLTQTQAQLIQSEKMASLGQMVAGLAHEINTPLGFVLTNVGVIERNVSLFTETLTHAKLLVDLLENGDLETAFIQLQSVKTSLLKLNEFNLIDKTKIRINEAFIGLDRIKELIINLKNFSRLDEAEIKKINLNDSLESSLLIANNLIKHKAEIETHFAESVFVECYPAQLNQVFLNIITNAAQAIPEFGKITITTRKESHHAEVIISDNGIGISDENLKRIFEPFYTTKPIGQGTGLGLSIVYKIIEKHNGSIEVKSKLGEGTTFSIKLPFRQEKEKPSLLAG